jgi:hypothetical protein
LLQVVKLRGDASLLVAQQAQHVALAARAPPAAGAGDACGGTRAHQAAKHAGKLLLVLLLMGQLGGLPCSVQAWRQHVLRRRLPAAAASRLLLQLEQPLVVQCTLPHRCCGCIAWLLLVCWPWLARAGGCS